MGNSFSMATSAGKFPDPITTKFIMPWIDTFQWNIYILYTYHHSPTEENHWKKQTQHVLFNGSASKIHVEERFPTGFCGSQPTQLTFFLVFVGLTSVFPLPKKKVFFSRGSSKHPKVSCQKEILEPWLLSISFHERKNSRCLIFPHLFPHSGPLSFLETSSIQIKLWRTT